MYEGLQLLHMTLIRSLKGFFYAMIKTNYDRVSRSLRQIRPATARRLHDLARKGIAGRWILLADEHSYEWFKEQSDTALEDYLRSYFASNICERWLALRVELIIITVLLLSCILALFVFQDLSGMMGLCLVCTLGLSDPLITFIRSHSEWEVRGKCNTPSLSFNWETDSKLLTVL